MPGIEPGAFHMQSERSTNQFISIIYSHNTVQLHGIHVSVTKYNVCINNNNKNNKNSIYK